MYSHEEVFKVKSITILQTILFEVKNENTINRRRFSKVYLVW